MNKVLVVFLLRLAEAIKDEKFKDGAHLTTKELLALQAAWLERQAEKEETIKL